MKTAIKPKTTILEEHIIQNKIMEEITNLSEEETLNLLIKLRRRITELIKIYG